MMGLHPFDTMLGFGHPYRMQPHHVREPPHRSPHPSSRPMRLAEQDRASPPDVKIALTEKADHYQVTLSAPERASISDARASLVDDRILIEGALTTEPDASYTYMTRCRAGIYEEPSERALVGFIPSGQRVSGGSPTRSGWIALDDDESWMLDDGSLVLISRPAPAQAIPFVKKVSLPADAMPANARSQPNGRNGLLVTIPRAACRESAPRKVSIQGQRRPAPPQHGTQAAAKRPPAAPAAPAAKPAATTSATPAAPEAVKDQSISAESWKQAHKRRAAERRGLAEELADLHGLEYAGPVLREVGASSCNVQSPIELVEEWTATTGGGFVRGDATAAVATARAQPNLKRPACAGTALRPTERSEEEGDLAFWGF